MIVCLSLLDDGPTLTNCTCCVSMYDSICNTEIRFESAKCHGRITVMTGIPYVIVVNGLIHLRYAHSVSITLGQWVYEFSERHLHWLLLISISVNNVEIQLYIWGKLLNSNFIRPFQLISHSTSHDSVCCVREVNATQFVIRGKLQAVQFV